MRSRLLALTGAEAALLLAGACGLPSTTAPAEASNPSDQPTLVAAPAGPAGPAGGPVPTGTATAVAAPTGATPAGDQPAGDQPVATRPGSFEKVKVQATLYPVRRSGETASVNLYIVAEEPGEAFMLFDSLSDGNTETSSKSLTSVDGVRLVDPVGKKAYLPAVTADGQCVCSPDDTATTHLQSSVWVTVTFAAPPAQLTAINVTVPTFGTFTDVPLR